MAITNKESAPNVNGIADGIYRISTPVAADLIPGGFTFNQYLIVDDAAAFVPHRAAQDVR